MKSVNATKHTWPDTHTHICTRSLSHTTDKRARIQVFFLLYISIDSLVRIKWSARAVASVNRDLDLVKESIRLQQYRRARVRFKTVLFIFILKKLSSLSVGTVAAAVCCCRLNSSLILNTHTLYSLSLSFSLQSEFPLCRLIPLFFEIFTRRTFHVHV